MKTFILLWGLPLLFIASLGYGQQFHGGLMAGVAGTQVDGDSFSGYKKAGIFGGGYVNLDVGKASALQMELCFFQKGSRVNPDSANNFRQYIFKTSYIELPIIYQHVFGRFRLFIGPSAGFLLSYYEEAQYQVKGDEPDYNHPARVTLQLNAGMQYFFTEKWGVDFRTNQSILNIRSGNMSGDIYRLWGKGQYHNTLVLAFIYQFK